MKTLNELIPNFVAALLAFAESKDPNEEYQYTEPEECAIAQFVKSHFPDSEVSVTSTVIKVDEEDYKIPFEVNSAVCGVFEDAWGEAARELKKLV